MAVRVMSLPGPRARQATALSFLITTFAVVVQPVVGQQSSASHVHQTVCGTKFIDPSSSAILADVVLQGNVQDLHQASPITPLLYKAKVTVHKVLKGQNLLTTGLLHTLDPDNDGTGSNGGSNNNYTITATTTTTTTTTTAAPAKSRPVRHVEVERFGPDENKENCVAHVREGNTYLFFLRVKDVAGVAATGAGRPRAVGVQSTASPLPAATIEDDDMPLLVNTALPVEMDLKGLRQVKKALCPGCPTIPVIKRLKCKACALAPKMKKKMSASDVKKVKAGKKLALRCVARGSPRPSYIWVKDGTILHSPEERGEAAGDGQPGVGGQAAARRGGNSPSVYKSGSMIIRDSRKHSLLVIKKATPDDQGTYHCLATNAVGEAEQSVEVVVEGGKRPVSLPRNDLDLDSRPPPDLGPQESGGPQPSSSSSSACATNPCYNSGTCYPDERVSRLARCECPPAYHGNRCQFRRRRPAGADDVEDGSDEDSDAASDDENPPSSSSAAVDTDTQPDVTDQNNNAENNTQRPQTSGSNSTFQTTQTGINASASVNLDNSPDPDGSAAAPAENDDVSTRPRTTPTPPISPQRKYLSKKKRRKYVNAARRPYGGGTSRSKSVAPQLRVTECPEEDYCFNGGTCKIVAKIQRRFCDCPRGYAGRRCELVVV